MHSGLSRSISALNSVATGSKPADLVLHNCSLVNVYTREIIPDTEISISQGRIAYVGKNASHTKGEQTVIIDLEKKILEKKKFLQSLNFYLRNYPIAITDIKEKDQNFHAIFLCLGKLFLFQL